MTENLNIALEITNAFDMKALSAMKRYTAEAAAFNRELVRISQTAGNGLSAIPQMNKSILDAAKKTGESYQNILGGYKSLAANGLNTKEITATMNSVSIAMATTGANADSLASALAATSQNFGFDLSNARDSEKILDMMYVAGKRGNAGFEELASIFSRAAESAKMAGMDFEQSLAVIEQLSLTERNPERLATLFESMTRLWTNNTYLKNAQNATGVKFFDDKGNRQDMFTVLNDLQGQYGQLQTEQQQNDWIYRAFGKTDLDTRRAMSIMLGSKGGISNISNTRKIYEDITKASGQLKDDFNEATNNMVSQLGRAGESIKEAFMKTGSILDKSLTPVLKAFNDSLDKGNNREIFNQQVGLGLAGLAGIGILGQFGKFKNLLDKNTFFGKASSGAQGIFAGKMYEQMAGVTPVYVVNMPQGGFAGGSLPGGNPPLGPTGPMPAPTNWKTPIGKMPKGGLIGMGLMALAGGWEIGQAINYGANVITGGKWENMTFGLEKVVGGIMDLFDKERQQNNKIYEDAEKRKIDAVNKKIFGSEDPFNIKNEIKVYTTWDKNGNLIDTKTLEQKHIYGYNPFSVAGNPYSRSNW